MIAQFSGREFVGGEFGGGSTGRPAAVCRSKAGTSTPWLSRVDVSLLSSMGNKLAAVCRIKLLRRLHWHARGSRHRCGRDGCRNFSCHPAWSRVDFI